MFVVAVASIMSAAMPARASDIILIADARGKQLDTATAALANAGHRVEVRLVDDANALATKDGTVFLAAGKRSAAALAAASSSSSRSSAAFLVKRADAPSTIASVVLEPSPEAQLAWARIAFPGRTRVVMPRNDKRDDEAWQQAAKRTGMTLVLVDVRAPGEAVPALAAALPGAPSIIVFVADPIAVTPDTVAPLVQSALASRTPAIGFASYFLKVGALAAVHVDVGASALQALDLALAPPLAIGSPSTTSLAVAPTNGRLVVDGKLAERLGVVTREGAGVEVRR